MVLSLSKMGPYQLRRISFDLINKGSEILIEEFPSSEDFIDRRKN